MSYDADVRGDAETTRRGRVTADRLRELADAAVFELTARGDGTYTLVANPEGVDLVVRSRESARWAAAAATTIDRYLTYGYQGRDLSEVRNEMRSLLFHLPGGEGE